MSIIIRAVLNTTLQDIQLFIPGYNTVKPPVVVPAHVNVDLFTVITGDELEAIQPVLDEYVARGEFIVMATVDTSTFTPIGGGGGSSVSSINALTGAITLAAGTNIGIGTSGNTLTFNSFPSGVLSLQSDSNPTLTGAVKLTSGTNISLSQVGQAIMINAASAVASPSGAVQFDNNGSFGGTNNFIWDNTNNYLGIGTATPSTFLEVDSSAGRATDGIRSTYEGTYITLRGNAGHGQPGVTTSSGNLDLSNVIVGGFGGSSVCLTLQATPGGPFVQAWNNHSGTQVASVDPLGNIAGQSLMLTPNATQPGSPVAGQIIYNSTLNKLQFFDGTAWETITSA